MRASISRRITPSEEMPADAGAWVSLGDVTRHTDLADAIASLPLRHRTVVVLHDIEGLTHYEIARRLVITEATSKSCLARARQRLRSMSTHVKE